MLYASLSKPVLTAIKAAASLRSHVLRHRMPPPFAYSRLFYRRARAQELLHFHIRALAAIKVLCCAADRSYTMRTLIIEDRPKSNHRPYTSWYYHFAVPKKRAY